MYLGVAFAVGAAAWLVGWTSVAAAKAQEDAVTLRLREVSSDQRAVQVVYHVPVGASDSSGPRVDAFFGRLSDVLDPIHRVRDWHRVGPVRLFVADEPRRDVVMEEGRLPRRCGRFECEVVVLAGRYSVGDEIALSPTLTARVVGRGSFTRAAFPAGSDVLRSTPDLTDEALLARTFSAPLEAAARDTGFSATTTSSLAPDRVHGSSLRELSSRLHAYSVRLRRGAQLLEVAAPLSLLDQLADRGDVARERLLLVAGQGAILLIAFAAFAASTRREESTLLAEQLNTLAASRRQQLLLRAIDVALPCLGGTLAALGALVLAVWVIRSAAGLPRDFLTAALPFQTVFAMLVLAVIAALVLGLSLAQRRRPRLGVGPLEIAAAAALGLIVWQAVSTGGLSASQLAAGRGPGPLLFLLPGLAFFVTAVLLLRVVPPALRFAERAARRGPFSLRLGLLSAARRPREVASVTTFLAVSLGASVFALNYQATLRSQARDEADFRAGAMWRVLEEPRRQESSGSLQPRVGGDIVPPTIADARQVTRQGDVTPLTRFSAASVEAPKPAIRFIGAVRDPGSSGNEIKLEVLGFPADRTRELGGWRHSYSSLSQATIGQRLASPGRGLIGPRVADDASQIRVRMQARETVYDRFAVLHFLRPADQVFVHVELGNLTSRSRILRLRVGDSLRGAELIGIEFPPSDVRFGGPDDNGTIEFSPFQQYRRGKWEPLGRLDAWTAAQTGTYTIGQSGKLESVRNGRILRFHLRATAIPLVRPPIAPAVPAIASPEIAQNAVDGILNVVVNSQEIRFRVAGTSSFFPTVIQASSRFLVADYDALFAAMNATFPGVASPTEAWFFEAQPPSFTTALARPPFRVSGLFGREPLRERLGSDPLAAGAEQVLGLTAFAGALICLIGLLLGARTSLHAERALSAEYEALGVPPSTLARSSQLRLGTVSAAGIAAGLLGGLLALLLVGSFVAVTGAAEEPLPPIRPSVWWLAVAGVTLAVGALALLAVAVLAHRMLREVAGGRLRA